MAAIDEHAATLYALEPERFTSERDRLAGTLKAAGDADGARAVKALRRPTVAAWAIDAAVRAEPRLAHDVRDAGASLGAAQRRAVSGGGGETLRAATEERRRAVRALTGAAVAVLQGDGRSAAAHRDAIEATIEAASVDDELGARLLAGTLDREARARGSLGILDGLTVLAGGEAEGAPVGPKPTRTKRDRASKADAERRRRDIAVADAVRDAERTAAAAARADRNAAKAKDRAARLRARADEADAAAREAEAQARHLASAAATERRRADRAATIAGLARRRVEQLDR